MKIFLSLSKMLLLSFLGFGKSGEKLNPKKILKTVLIGILVLYMIASFGVIFVLTSYANYQALSPSGLQEYMILNNIISVSILTIFLGIVTAMGVYSMSDAEQTFMALPIKPWQFFASKFLLVYLSEVSLSLIVTIPMLAVFGYMQHPGFLFYLNGIISIFLIPVLPVCLIFFVLVPLLRIFRRIRKKNLLMIVAGAIGISGLLAYQLFYQSVLIRISEPQWLVDNFTGPDSFLTVIAKTYPPSLLLWKAVSPTGGLQGIFYMFLSAVLSTAVLMLTIGILSKPYVQSLQGFNESVLKRLKDSALFIRKNFQKKTKILSLTKREFVLMNREPVYFFNGPFIIILMPVILVIMYIVQKPVLAKALNGQSLDSYIALFKTMPVTAYITAACGVFLASGSMISASAFSRDAKSLGFLKSLPLSAGEIALGKFCHAAVFAILGIVVGTVVPNIVLGLGMQEWMISMLFSVVFTMLSLLSSLFFDTAFMRTKWNTPTAAFKQNPNSMVGFLLPLVFATGFILPVYLFNPPTWPYAFCILGSAGILLAFLFVMYRSYVEKRLYRLEI